MVKDKFQLTGHVKLYSFPADKFPTYESTKKLSEAELRKYLIDEGDNRVVDAGAQQIIDLMIDQSDVGFAYCQNGSGTNAVAAGDTDLQTPIGSRVAVTNRYRSSLSAKYDTFFSTTDENGSWEETGLFTTSTSGIMLCRKRYSSTFTKSSSNTATVAWTITLAPQ